MMADLRKKTEPMIAEFIKRVPAAEKPIKAYLVEDEARLTAAVGWGRRARDRHEDGTQTGSEGGRGRCRAGGWLSAPAIVAAPRQR